jgi:hypothetical protein
MVLLEVVVEHLPRLLVVGQLLVDALRVGDLPAQPVGEQQRAAEELLGGGVDREPLLHRPRDHLLQLAPVGVVHEPVAVHTQVLVQPQTLQQLRRRDVVGLRPHQPCTTFARSRRLNM